MGQYLSAGILHKIYISKRRSSRSKDDDYIKNNLDTIISDINEFIDTSKYDVVYEENDVFLKLNIGYINAHLKDLLYEVRNINKRINFLHDITSDDEEINEDFMKKHKINVYNDGNIFILDSDKNELHENMPFYPFYWIISNMDIFFNVEIRGCFIPVWIDDSKIDAEDQTFLLMALNKLKTEYFKSELSKCLIFEIMD